MNAQAMLDLLRANENAPAVDMDNWFNDLDCATHGCLLGNYAISLREKHHNDLYELLKLARSKLQLSLAEDRWLFVCLYPKKDSKNNLQCFVVKDDGEYKLSFKCDANNKKPNDKNLMLNRLRKFIYYKLRKQEFIVDEKYGIKESARKAEGNQNFVKQALAAV